MNYFSRNKKVTGTQTAVKEVTEEVEFNVARYVALESVFLNIGVVVLSGYSQLAKQARRCKCINEKDGVFQIEGKIVFKKGEVFEYDGDLKRAVQIRVSTDSRLIAAAVRIRDAKDKAVDKIREESDRRAEQAAKDKK